MTIAAEKLDPERVSVPGAARFLNCAESHVRKMADSGALPCTRDPNTNARIFLVADLKKFAITHAADKLVRRRQPATREAGPR